MLVVDDDGNQRALMRDLLAPLGFVVMEASDAASCRTLTEAIAPDLFLLDVSMPGEDGWSLARSLRARGQTGAIIMLSAHLTDADAPLDAGAAHDATLPKPFALARLMDRIHDLLRLDWVEASTASDRPPRVGRRRRPSTGSTSTNSSGSAASATSAGSQRG